MSGRKQTTLRSQGMSDGGTGEFAVSELLLYGLDAEGETAFTQALPRQDAAALRSLAQERLNDFHTVEVWDGALCVVRLRRRSREQA